MNEGNCPVDSLISSASRQACAPRLAWVSKGPVDVKVLKALQEVAKDLQTLVDHLLATLGSDSMTLGR